MQSDNLLEKFSDVLDASNDFLYEKTKKNYFELILMTADNILSGEVKQDLENKDIEKLNEIYKPLMGVDFPVDVVLKALQYIILKGFKETNMKNGETTPDTLGMFIAYLITKLQPKAKHLNILDPLAGCGNLLLNVSNALENKELNLFACDHNETMVKLLKMCSDMIQRDVEIYFEDTFNLHLKNMDNIIFDLPNVYQEDKEYFPFKAILHYVDLLNDDGFIIGIIPNDFFAHDKDQSFKKELIKKMSIVGLIELPQQMFKLNPKSILILQKKNVERKCMLVKLPSFTDIRALSNSLAEIETWFEKNMNN